MHIQAVLQNPNDLIAVARFSSISQTLAIMSCALGKTAFAVTLLRIVVERWMKYLLWFIITTMNTVNTLAALFVFVQCKDPRTNWDPSVVSECWPTDVFTNYSLFVGGEDSHIYLLCVSDGLQHIPERRTFSSRCSHGPSCGTSK
jgi:hypothetical protein